MEKKRGGARVGAGRKRDPAKDLQLGAASARKVLDRLKHEDAVVTLFETCGDARLKASIIFRLREQAFGKPGKVGDEEKPKGNSPLHCIVEFVGGDA